MNAPAPKKEEVPAKPESLPGMPASPRAVIGGLTRIRLNELLDEKLDDRAVLERLGSDGAGLGPEDIADWRKTGYLRWKHRSLLRNDGRDANETTEELLASLKTSSYADASLRLLAPDLLLFYRRLHGRAHAGRFGDLDQTLKFFQISSRFFMGLLQQAKKSKSASQAQQMEFPFSEPGTHPDDGIPAERLQQIEEMLKLM